MEDKARPGGQEGADADPGNPRPWAEEEVPQARQTSQVQEFLVVHRGAIAEMDDAQPLQRSQPGEACALQGNLPQPEMSGQPLQLLGIHFRVHGLPPRPMERCPAPDDPPQAGQLL
jgi:hypothetical protein